MLTDEQITRYIESPYHCPYCNSNNITAGQKMDDAQEVTCEQCGEGWFDVLDIVNIIEED